MVALSLENVSMALVLMIQMKKWQNKNKMTRGGAREGAGRPTGPTGTARKMRSIRLSDAEYTAVKKFVKELRRKKDENVLQGFHGSNSEH
jgi:hypothetical protein